MMDETAVLIIAENGKDESGFAVETVREIEIYVREKSATRSEFYEAMRSGIKVKLILETRIEDFEMSAYITGDGRKEYASRVLYDGGTYDIIRTYRTNKGTIELTCS